MFNKKDKEEYTQYLKKQIKKQLREPRTIAQRFNLNNLYEDLNNLTGEYKTRVNGNA